MLDSSLLERFRQGDRLALSRLVTLVARGEQTEAILTSLARDRPQPARVVALTGSGGGGKSTLAGKLIEEARKQGQTVAVLACDPQSPLSGGALLGDRFRMPSRPDDGVFIRSLAAAGGQGALAEHLDALVRLLETFGFDLVLIETVGAGQGDTVVRQLVDVLVLLLQPETGDDLQWEKAGLLEVADVVAIHKADLPGADRVEAQVLASLGLGQGPPPPVVRVSSRTGQGLSELYEAIGKVPLRRGLRGSGHELLRLAQQILAARFAEAADGAEVRRLVEQWQRGTIGEHEAAAALLRMLAEQQFSE
jgi:LAO/AO transport system ATPase